MRRFEAVAVVALVLVASWVVGTALPEWREVAWAGGVLIILAFALAAVTARAAALRHSRRTPFGSLVTTAEVARERPADLERIERLSGWVAYSRLDFSHRLKPLIVSLIARRLQISRGIDLVEGDAPPPGLLSPELTALIDPSGEEPATSITTADLHRALDEIEAL
jgi:hypothetical protein